MAELRIGIHLASLKLPLRKALQTAARLGATAVEVDARREINPRELSQTGLRQFRKLIEDLQLRVCAVGFRTRRGYHTGQDLQRRVDATKEAMTFAYSLGASVVVNHVGAVPTDTETSEWSTMVDSLTDIGRHGQKCGAMLAATTAGTENGEQLAKLIRAIPDGTLGINFDPASLIANGYSAVDTLEHLAAHVLQVYARDGTRDLTQGRGVEVPMGRGSVDFSSVIGMLEECNYTGCYTAQRLWSDDPTTDIGQAVQYLQNL